MSARRAPPSASVLLPSTSSRAPSKGSKAPAKQEKAKPKKKNAFLQYFSDVRSEMKRVTWPSKGELTNWSVAVIVALVVFGLCVYLVDTGFVALLVGFTGLRG